MRFRDGTLRQKALFAALVGIYVLGLALSAQDKRDRVGAPDVGWVMEGASVSPTRPDASAHGLRGGGRALRVNGVELDDALVRTGVHELLRSSIGETNTLTLQKPTGAVIDVTLRVQPWEWPDALFAEGVPAALGLLFFVVGVVSFVIRPYAPESWASLALCTLIGGLATTTFLPIGPGDTAKALYFRGLIGFLTFVPFHAGLAFPVVHPILLRRPQILYLIYGLGLGHAVTQFMGWSIQWAGPLAYMGAVDSIILTVAVLFFVGRCAVLAARTRDPLVAQRARIILAGTTFGCGPVVFMNLARNTLGAVTIDPRITILSLSLFLLALAYVTLRHDLMNARVAVQRTVLYGAMVGILTFLAILLVSVRPYAVAVLLLPLLYWWPRFNARLNAWLYPKRAHFPELLRALGAEMAACATVGEVLGLLADAPRRLCDAGSSVAFLFPGVAGPSAEVAISGQVHAGDPSTLADEVLVKLMGTTRKEIFRAHIAVGPQYSNIERDCYRGFDRLGAQVLLPILQERRVVGGLALGPRTTDEVYQAAEIDALSTLVQQAVQAMTRIEATERLRSRELEFTELKRFFPPEIIDQVMAKGGAAELRSQRKLVTVFFADLRGFTEFSESVEPEEVMATLAEYHSAMGRRIAEFSGTLERFAGDAFMVVFNDPVEQKDHVERAVRMAVAMRRDISRLRDTWMRKGYHIDVGMGIHTGYATCGFIGYEGRRDYGVIGNVTNLAARLSDAATGGEILVSARVQAELPPGEYAIEPAGDLTLKGFQHPQAAYRLPMQE